MTVAQAIQKHIASLPENTLQEVLDFVEFLEMKRAATATPPHDQSWSNFSLASAMHGLESEESPYTLADIREERP